MSRTTTVPPPAGANARGSLALCPASGCPTQPTAPWFQSRALAVALVLLAGWPVLRWYVLRLRDGSDEPLGLLPLLAAILFLPRDGWREPISPRRRWSGLVVLSGYAVSFPWLPPLAHAFLWLAALAATVAPRSYALAWSALLVLALPVTASIQFYLGYPMRCITTQAAAWLLEIGGIQVAGVGTVLQWSGERVLIDAPCAGIQMLWTLLVATAVVATHRRLGNGAALRLFRWAAAAVFAGNVLRAVAVFWIETRSVHSLPGGHETIGLALFSASAGVLLWRAKCETRRAEGSALPARPLWARRGFSLLQRITRATAFGFGSTKASMPQPKGRADRIALLLFPLIACAAVASPWIHAKSDLSAQAAPLDRFPGWDAAPMPRGLTPVELGPREARFSREFPGRIAAFSDGRTTWVVRWVETPTRKLHPAADCLRGAGFAVTPGAAHADSAGRLWAGCTATGEGRTLRVTERIFSQRGTGWTDVSAWYWHAVFGRDTGPWWAITKLETGF